MEFHYFLDADGQVATEFYTNSKGKMVGTYLQYLVNSNHVTEMRHYNDKGQLHGVLSVASNCYRTCYDITNYVNGKRHGESTVLVSHNAIQTTTYSHGKRLKQVLSYSGDKSAIRSIIVFDDNNKKASETTYRKYGKAIRTNTYENGKLKNIKEFNDYGSEIKDTLLDNNARPIKILYSLTSSLTKETTIQYHEKRKISHSVDRYKIRDVNDDLASAMESLCYSETSVIDNTGTIRIVSDVTLEYRAKVIDTAKFSVTMVSFFLTEKSILNGKLHGSFTEHKVTIESVTSLLSKNTTVNINQDLITSTNYINGMVFGFSKELIGKGKYKETFKFGRRKISTEDAAELFNTTNNADLTEADRAYLLIKHT